MPDDAQTSVSSLRVPPSADPAPHFERVNGRQVLYVDGWPYSVLTVETHWSDLIYGRYHETMGAYDYLYPAARALGLNAIKVPIKWSVVEPQKGVYDFAYLDHVIAMARANDLRLVLGWFGHYASSDGTIYRSLAGDVFAPMYVIEDDETYPRAVDADGRAHHNAISYDYDPIIEVESAAFRAFMEHIRAVDEGTRTVLMVQVENEIAVFGHDRRNRKMWRDHSPASESRFREARLGAQGFTDDLRYSAWSLSSRWIRTLTDVGAAAYPIPLFLNYVGGTIVDWMVGGAPGEDVATYLEQCANLSFIGLNLYTSRQTTANDFRASLGRYRVGRNIPAITETNSDRGPNAPRLAYIAVGELGAPLFAPWSMSMSYPTTQEPYVLPDGAIANGGPALRDCYVSLRLALPLISIYAGSQQMAVFVAPFPDQAHSEMRDVNGAEVHFSNSVWALGAGDGQAVVIHPAENEFVIVGYRCQLSITTPMAQWPALKRVHVEKGVWERGAWVSQGDYAYGVDQSRSTIGVGLAEPAAVYVHW